MTNTERFTQIETAGNNGFNFHGARFYELPAMFPKAFDDSPEKQSSSPEMIRHSLTGAVYFSKSFDIASAYPMLERRTNGNQEVELPELLLPTGVVLIVHEEQIKARELEQEEIDLIKKPNHQLVKLIQVVDGPIPIKSISAVNLLLFISLYGDVRDVELDYYRLQEKARVISDKYPWVKTRVNFKSTRPEEAISIIKST